MKRIVMAGLGLVISLGMMGQTIAQTTQAVDVQALTKDVQVMRQGSEGMRLVFWMPKEFWDASMATTMPAAEQRNLVLQRMEGYEIVAVLEGKVGAMGVLLGTSREDLAKKVSLQVGTTTLKSLTNVELSAEMQQFLQTMQPMLSQMMGQLGQNMHMLVFKSTDANGKRLLDPKQPGSFKLMLGAEAFAFRLPLGSLLPPLFDADSGEQYPGNYVYSPYTGKKLLTSKP